MKTFLKQVATALRFQAQRSRNGQRAYQSIASWTSAVKTIRRDILRQAFNPEMGVLDQIIKEGDICFDIGASYGKYTLVMSRLAGRRGHIYGFEPGSSSTRTFLRVVKFYRLKNVTLTKKALSHQEGLAHLVIPIKETGSLGEPIAHLGRGDESNAVIEKIETMTLDGYCSESGISRVDFIKCDVEGSELLVLEGAKNTIRHHRPIILCEIGPITLRHCGNHVGQLFDLLTIPDYCVFKVRDGRLKKAEETEEVGDFFFVHKEDPFLVLGEGSELLMS